MLPIYFQKSNSDASWNWTTHIKIETFFQLKKNKFQKMLLLLWSSSNFEWISGFAGILGTGLLISTSQPRSKSGQLRLTIIGLPGRNWVGIAFFTSGPNMSFSTSIWFLNWSFWKCLQQIKVVVSLNGIPQASNHNFLLTAGASLVRVQRVHLHPLRFSMCAMHLSSGALFVLRTENQRKPWGIYSS